MIAIESPTALSSGRMLGLGQVDLLAGRRRVGRDVVGVGHQLV